MGRLGGTPRRPAVSASGEKRARPPPCSTINGEPGVAIVMAGVTKRPAGTHKRTKLEPTEPASSTKQLVDLYGQPRPGLAACRETSDFRGRVGPVL